MSAGTGLRVLLVSPNRERSPDIVPPLAFAHLAPVLSAAGIEVATLDLQLVPDGEAALREKLEEVQPSVVGLSIRNLDNCAWPDSVSFLPQLSGLVGILQAYGVPVIVGGAGVGIMPEAVLTVLGLDVAVAGEAEHVLVPLVRTLAAGKPVPELPGVVVRGADGFRSLPPAAIRDLGALPPPDYSILDPVAYKNLGGVVGVQTRRGCPFTCSYCVYPSIEGHRNRLRPPEQVADDIRRLYGDFGIDRVFLVDSVFNEPERHAIAVARAIGALDLPVQYGCYLTPRRLSRELALALLESGCEGGEFGSDSFSDPVLAGLGKPFRRKDIEETIAACREAGLPQVHHLIFGGPGETPATVRETLDAAEAWAPDALVAMAGVRVYPGTSLAETLRASGVELPDLSLPYQYVSPAVVDTIEDTLLAHARDHAGWILPGSGHNCDPVLFDRIRQTGYRGPAWALLRRMRL